MPYDIENRMVVDSEWDYLEERRYHSNKNRIYAEQQNYEAEERAANYDDGRK